MIEFIIAVTITLLLFMPLFFEWNKGRALTNKYLKDKKDSFDRIHSSYKDFCIENNEKPFENPSYEDIKYHVEAIKDYK